MDFVVEDLYRPMIENLLVWRYAVLASSLALLILTFGLIGAGAVKFEFFPEVEADAANATLTLPQGTPVAVTSQAVRQIEEAAFELKRQLAEEGHEDAFTHILSSVGEQPFAVMTSQNGPSMGGATAAASSTPHLGEVTIELAPAQTRTVQGGEITRRWRELTGPVPDAVELSFASSLISFGAAIDVQLISSDLDQLRQASDYLKTALREYPATRDITDSYRAGKKELKIDLHPRGEALGLTLSDLARQVRQGFYGAEAQRIQRGRDEVRVMVRYPEDERGSLASLENMRIRTPSGEEVPFAYAGTARLGRGFASIQRTNRRRTLHVTADVDPAAGNANEIVADIEESILPRLLNKFPRVEYSMAGEQEEMRENFGALFRAFGVALLLIYALLAIPFRSYLQPAIVMSAIPFGIIGAVFGHLVLGMNLSMLSIFGVIALTGVVVNDSLVMVDFINRYRQRGVPLDLALRDAGIARFRPILLTSLTTFVGLTPLILEKSIQAQFLIPMALSLAFGVLFATGITLILVPIVYRILEDLVPSRRFSEQTTTEPSGHSANPSQPEELLGLETFENLLDLDLGPADLRAAEFEQLGGLAQLRTKLIDIRLLGLDF